MIPENFAMQVKNISDYYVGFEISKSGVCYFALTLENVEKMIELQREILELEITNLQRDKINKMLSETLSLQWLMLLQRGFLTHNEIVT